MYELERTEEYKAWLDKLRDRVAKRRIFERLARVQLGNFGDVKWVGDGVRPLRVDFGPGYRVYFARRTGVVLLLLIGGDKQSQQRDIARAKEIHARYGDDDAESDSL